MFKAPKLLPLPQLLNITTALIYSVNASFIHWFNPIQTGGGGVWRHPDLNPLLLTNDCVYSVPTSWFFLKFIWEQFRVVRFW